MKNLIIIFIALMTTNQSCSNKKIAQSESKSNSMEEKKTIESNKWFLTKMGSEEVNNKNAFLELDLSTLKFSGKSFCNNYFGKMLTDNKSSLELSSMGSTLMACQDMSQEEKFTSLLQTVKTYDIINDELVLFNKDSKQVLAFSTDVPKEVKTENTAFDRLYDIWGLKTMNSKTITATTGMMIEMNTKEMTFMGNASCNNIFGTIVRGEENELNFVNIGATRKLCPDMENENDFITALKKVKTYEIKSMHLLLFDENQKLVLDFIKMD